MSAILDVCKKKKCISLLKNNFQAWSAETFWGHFQSSCKNLESYPANCLYPHISPVVPCVAPIIVNFSSDRNNIINTTFWIKIPFSRFWRGGGGTDDCYDRMEHDLMIKKKRSKAHKNGENTDRYIAILLILLKIIWWSKVAHRLVTWKSIASFVINIVSINTVRCV